MTRVESNTPPRPHTVSSPCGSNNAANWQAQWQMAFMSSWHDAGSGAQADQGYGTRSQAATPLSSGSGSSPLRHPMAQHPPRVTVSQAASSGNGAAFAVLAPSCVHEGWTNPTLVAGNDQPVETTQTAPADGHPVASFESSPCSETRPTSNIGFPRESPMGFRDAPPRYAKQLMQLSLASDPQVTLRDAAISASAMVPVALGIAHEMRMQGVVLQRLFINGRRFDAAQLASAGNAIYPETRQHNDQE